MKLIYCLLCGDIKKLDASKKECLCGASWGHYTDNINVVIGGRAIPIGFVNREFTEAVILGHGTEFTAFRIPDTAKTVQREGGT